MLPGMRGQRRGGNQSAQLGDTYKTAVLDGRAIRLALAGAPIERSGRNAAVVA